MLWHNTNSTKSSSKKSSKPSTKTIRTYLVLLTLQNGSYLVSHITTILLAQDWKQKVYRWHSSVIIPIIRMNIHKYTCMKKLNHKTLGMDGALGGTSIPTINIWWHSFNRKLLFNFLTSTWNTQHTPWKPNCTKQVYLWHQWYWPNIECPPITSVQNNLRMHQIHQATWLLKT